LARSDCFAFAISKSARVKNSNDIILRILSFISKGISANLSFAGIFTLQMISPYCASKFKARREMPDQEYVTFMRSHFYFKLGDESGIGHVMW
jgi:hypothetical protein